MAVPTPDGFPFNDGGYMIHPGYFRVPDLLDEERFIAYLKDTYGVNVRFLTDDEVEFVDGLRNPVPEESYSGPVEE